MSGRAEVAFLGSSALLIQRPNPGAWPFRPWGTCFPRGQQHPLSTVVIWLGGTGPEVYL